MKYKISELSNLLNVSTNTIRRYEKMGYITSKRSESSNYRYYTEEDLSTFISVRLLRKYGFTHPEISDMKKKKMTDLISIYEERLNRFDEQIRYLTNLRHRLKDDLVLMRKTNEFSQQFYKRESVAFSYVLYQSGEKILTEPKRILTIQDYIYKSPEVQRIYLIRREDVENGSMMVHAGWAVKLAHLERYKIMENEYSERYERRDSLITMVKLPVHEEAIAKDEMMREPLKYMQAHNLRMDGDMIGIIIANSMEDQQEFQHILVSVPIVNL